MSGESVDVNALTNVFYEHIDGTAGHSPLEHDMQHEPRFSEIVAVIGLGYVGLPLAVEFGKHYRTIGFDVSAGKVADYERHVDTMGEVGPEQFAAARHFVPTTDPTRLAQADFIIVAVPTPIGRDRRPDLSAVEGATRTAGRNLKPGAVVVFESTVYPGVTEEVCVPMLERESGLVWKRDFHVGYSPERINPGDREHSLTRITKVVAGDTPETLDTVARLYGSIIKAGVYPTSTIREAEAAKVIENTQRDLNIALMNELAIIFDRLGIDTQNVLKAAGTKWNFLPFRPGLVGGHCIGVDPYYLTYRAEMAGYHPQVILAGRRINDTMGKFIAEKTVKLMIAAGRNIRGARVGILGLTFKEDCPDLRNSKVVDIIAELQSYGVTVLVHDPLADPAEARAHYGLDLVRLEDLQGLDALVVAVAHKAYTAMGTTRLCAMVGDGGAVVDVKGVLDRELAREAGIRLWRL
jgi:UDP-N-acetyl-D-galactosamine dehydrogenase